jgi:hypothetical protein
MSTSKEEIRAWLKEGQEEGATHVVVVCDTFSNEDYPVKVKAPEEVQKVVEKYHGPSMQRVMEVYALHLDLEAQLNEFRAFHLETAPKITSP